MTWSKCGPSAIGYPDGWPFASTEFGRQGCFTSDSGSYASCVFYGMIDGGSKGSLDVTGVAQLTTDSGDFVRVPSPNYPVCATSLDYYSSSAYLNFCDESLSGVADSGYRGCQTKTRSTDKCGGPCTCQAWNAQGADEIHQNTDYQPAQWPGKRAHARTRVRARAHTSAHEHMHTRCYTFSHSLARSCTHDCTHVRTHAHM